MGMNDEKMCPVPSDSVPPGIVKTTVEADGQLMAKDSTIEKLIQMVEDAQSEKAETQRFLDRAEQFYAIGVIVFTLALIVLPLFFLHEPFHSAFYRAMTVMVVASPCALTISTPASILSAIGGAARRGVLFKGGVHLERTATIGIAMGAAGTDVAMETADVVLMSDNLRNIPFAISISRHARTVIRQNLAIAMSVIVLLVASALGFSLPLTLGVVGHEGSTVLVCLNGLRLLAFRPKENSE
jgi:cation transport ATPase